MTTVADTTRPEGGPTTQPNVSKKIARAVARHKQWQPGWAENLAFVEGRQFVFTARAASGQTTIQELETREWGSKPRHKARTRRNRILELYLNEVSAGTQRVPGYEVDPTNSDPQVINAAKLSGKICLYLYDYLVLRKKITEAWGYAVSCGEGFLRPYWDPTGGEKLPPPPGAVPDEVDPLDPQEPEELYEGQLCMDAYGPMEVAWEPGMTFEQSKYHLVIKARTLDDAKAIPGYIGGDLRPDVKGNQSFVQGQLNKQSAQNDLVEVLEYLELPTEKNPEGARQFFANNKPITAPEPYPMVIKGTEGCYEPCIHKFRYIPTPWRDRDMGLVEHLIDPQRTINDANNKAIEFKNLGMVPQILAAKNQMIDKRPTNEPGAVREYNPVGGVVPQWMQPAKLPGELFQMMDRAVQDMEAISSRRSIPPQVDTAQGLEAFIQREASVHQFIFQGLADSHAKLARHLLIYVQEYFSEPRLLQIQGRHGLEFIPDFKGADLKDQVAVRVLAGSIEPQTREQVRQKVMGYAQMGWISGEKAMSAIEDGTAENLIETHDLHIAKAQREIMQMIALGDDKLPGGQVPIAKSYDQHAIHLSTLHDWMVTEEFERMPEPTQEAAILHEQQHQQLEAEAQAQAAQAQMEQAQGLGMSNAAKPQVNGKMPSVPGGLPQPGGGAPQGPPGPPGQAG